MSAMIRKKTMRCCSSSQWNGAHPSLSSAGVKIAFPLPAALQLRSTASRCTNGSHEDPGQSEGAKKQEVRFGTDQGAEGSCDRRIQRQEQEARTKWAVKGLLACKRRALEGTSLVSSRTAGNVTRGEFQGFLAGTRVGAAPGSTRAKGRYG
jgi:hypothetical protein